MSEVRQTEFNTPEIAPSPSPKGREERDPCTGEPWEDRGLRKLRTVAEGDLTNGIVIYEAEARALLARLRTHSPEEPVGYVVIRHGPRGMAFDDHDFPVDHDVAEVLARFHNRRERRATGSEDTETVWRIHPIGQPLDPEDTP